MIVDHTRGPNDLNSLTATFSRACPLVADAMRLLHGGRPPDDPPFHPRGVVPVARLPRLGESSTLGPKPRGPNRHRFRGLVRRSTVQLWRRHFVFFNGLASLGWVPPLRLGGLGLGSIASRLTGSHYPGNEATRSDVLPFQNRRQSNRGTSKLCCPVIDPTRQGAETHDRR